MRGGKPSRVVVEILAGGRRQRVVQSCPREYKEVSDCLTSSSLAALRPCNKTLWPRETSILAVSSPMPSVAPVSRMRFAISPTPSPLKMSSVFNDHFAHRLSALQSSVRSSNFVQRKAIFIKHWFQTARLNNASQVAQNLCVFFSFEVVQHRNQHGHDVQRQSLNVCHR